MTKDLTRHPGAPTGVAVAGAGTHPGHGEDINTASFTDPGYTWDEHIPTQFRQGVATSTALATTTPSRGTTVATRSTSAPIKSATELSTITQRSIASGVRQLTKPRKVKGRLVQRRIGWQATPSLIMVATAERELSRGDDQKLRPVGPWLLEHRTTSRNINGPAQKRAGRVNADPTATTTAPAAPDTPAGPHPFPEAAFALSFLPATVRSSVLARIPNPTLFDGAVLQFSDPKTGDPSRQQVDVIRMNPTTAVVVRATRAAGANVWDITQATYALESPEIEQA